MAEIYASEIQLVEVTTDHVVGGVATKELWAVAAPREQAIAILLEALPEGWTAVLSTAQLKPYEPALLKMRPGEVRELTR
jgi:hypothetical protein